MPSAPTVWVGSVPRYVPASALISAMVGSPDPNSGATRTVVMVFDTAIVVVVRTCFDLTVFFAVPQKVLPLLHAVHDVWTVAGPLLESKLGATVAATAMPDVALTTGEVAVTPPTAAAGKRVVAAFATHPHVKVTNVGNATPKQWGEVNRKDN